MTVRERRSYSLRYGERKVNVCGVRVTPHAQCVDRQENRRQDSTHELNEAENVQYDAERLE
jgi:hypothetical protein